MMQQKISQHDVQSCLRPVLVWSKSGLCSLMQAAHTSRVALLFWMSQKERGRHMHFSRNSQ